MRGEGGRRVRGEGRRRVRGGILTLVLHFNFKLNSVYKVCMFLELSLFCPSVRPLRFVLRF